MAKAKRFFKRVIIFFLCVAAVLVISGVVILSMALETAPRYAMQQELTKSDHNQASAFARRVSRQVIQVHKRSTITGSEAELNSVLSLANHTYPALTGYVRMQPEKAIFTLSLKLQVLGYVLYANTLSELHSSDKGIHWHKVSVGNVALNAPLSNIAFTHALKMVLGKAYAENILKGISNVSIDGQALHLDFGPPQNIREGFAAAAHNLSGYSGQAIDFDTVRVQHYLDFLVTLKRALPAQHVSLGVYIKALFVEARKQSNTLSLSPKQENLSALFALAVHTEPGVFRHFVADLNVKDVLAIGKAKLILHKRKDLAKHFVYSAAFHILAKKGVSFSLGEIKEIIDSRNGGSGFSFSDIAADRAGIRFAQVALDETLGANLLQEFSIINLKERDIFPSIAGLPDGLTQRDFDVQFRSVKSPTYKAMLREIDRRLDNTNILGIVD